MHVGTDSLWLDERTELNNVVGTIMINQQHCSNMIEHYMLSGNDEITRFNSDVTTTMNLVVVSKSGFACADIREQPLSIHHAVTMLYRD